MALWPPLRPPPPFPRLRGRGLRPARQLHDADHRLVSGVQLPHVAHSGPGSCGVGAEPTILVAASATARLLATCLDFPQPRGTLVTGGTAMPPQPAHAPEEPKRSDPRPGHLPDPRPTHPQLCPRPWPPA